MIKNATGRPQKVNFRVMNKLADAIAHNSNITDATRYCGISRQTFYWYMNNNPIFAEKMREAKEAQNKVVFSFLTIP